MNADAKSRAGLLEELTGTDIYSRISVDVFERNKAIRTKLAQQEARAGAIEMLTGEQQAALEDEMTQRKQEEQCHERQRHHAWLNERAQRQAVEQLAIATDENLCLPESATLTPGALQATADAPPAYAYEREETQLAQRLKQLQQAPLVWQSTRDALSAAELVHNRNLSARALNSQQQCDLEENMQASTLV